MTATEAAEIFGMTGDVKNPGDAVTVTNFSKEQCAHANTHTHTQCVIEVSCWKPLTVLSQQLKNGNIA